ncbi:MAG: hypothetical protein Q8N05_15535 [Bacteroidota bacterium]|nr:hypothetical protein [Bacteroidota bacterium]
MTELGQYTISTSNEDMVIGDEALITYELNYTNSDSPVLIGVRKTKKCMNFIVLIACYFPSLIKPENLAKI